MNILLSSIGRRGYIADYFRAALKGNGKVFGTSNTKWTTGFNHCDENFILPDIRSADYLNALICVCREKRVDAILSFFDQDIDVLSRNAELFKESGIVMLIPERTTNQICYDKLETFRFFRSRNVDVPLAFSSLEDTRQSLEKYEIKFPLVVKPRFGFGSANIFLARNFQELDTFFAYQPDMFVQEFMDGREHGLDMLFNLKSEVVSVYCKQKIAMRAGETDMAKMKYDEKLLDFGRRIGELLRHVGPMDVDFFVTGEGIPKLIEINPRFGGGYPISHLAGADFPRKIVQMLNGVKYSFSYEKYDDGVIMMKEYAFLNEFSDQIRSARVLPILKTGDFQEVTVFTN